MKQLCTPDGILSYQITNMDNLIGYCILRFLSMPSIPVKMISLEEAVHMCVDIFYSQTTFRNAFVKQGKMVNVKKTTEEKRRLHLECIF